MNDHLSKPIDPDALFTTLTRWAKIRPSAGEVRAKQDGERNGIVIPEIAGVNSADGLKRVAGNRRLYLDLLTQFAEKQGACECPNRLRFAAGRSKACRTHRAYREGCCRQHRNDGNTSGGGQS